MKDKGFRVLDSGVEVLWDLSVLEFHVIVVMVFVPKPHAHKTLNVATALKSLSPPQV